jgi:hypothetical protein
MQRTARRAGRRAVALGRPRPRAAQCQAHGVVEPTNVAVAADGTLSLTLTATEVYIEPPPPCCMRVVPSAARVAEEDAASMAALPADGAPLAAEPLPQPLPPHPQQAFSAAYLEHEDGVSDQEMSE